MKILFLSQLLPYPQDSGSKIKSYQTLAHLSQRHQLTLLSFIRSPQEHEHVPVLRRLCHHVGTVPLERSRLSDLLHFPLCAVTGRSLIIARDGIEEMAKRVRELTAQEGFDVFHADRLQMAQFVSSAPGVRVLDQHNVESEILRQWYRSSPRLALRLAGWLEWRNLRRYEAQTCRRFHHIFCLTPQDRTQLLEMLSPNGSMTISELPQFSVLPVGIDCSHFAPLPVVKKRASILFVGSLRWPPNADAAFWLARDILTRVRRAVPRARLTIVGDGPDSQLSQLSRCPGVTVTGRVEDIRPYFWQHAVLAVPLRMGSGIRIKILTALACGLPVVSTTKGCEGIAGEPGKHFLIEDDPDRFAAALAQVLTLRPLQERLARRGRELIEKSHDEQIVSRDLDRAYQLVADTRRQQLSILSAVSAAASQKESLTPGALP